VFLARRSRDRRNGWIAGNEIECFQIASQDVGIYLKPFSSYSVGKPVHRHKKGCS